MFDFLIFADTRPSILCLLIFIQFYFITKLYCDGYKEKVRRGYSEKNTKLYRKLIKVSPLKMLMLNVTYQEVAYMEEK